MAKVTLIKQITKYTGKVYYFVHINDEYQPESFTSDEVKAIEHYDQAIENTKRYPETIKEVEREVIF